MTEAGGGPPSSFQVVGATGRMLVFDSSDERSATREAKGAGIQADGGDRHAVLSQLAGLLDEQTVCFVGKGRMALAALQAADQASAVSIRIILEAPAGLSPAQLHWAGQSRALQRSDILILTGSATTSESGACARSVKAHLPRATLMFVYGAQDDIARDRPGLYLEAVADFLRRGSGFVIRN
jgi:hypothetical protein